MKSRNCSERQIARATLIAPILVLVLLSNSAVYADAQQSQNQAPSQKSDPGSAQTPVVAAPSTPSNRGPDADNAPVPPMPPLDPAESGSPSTDLLPDSPGTVEAAPLEAQQSPAPPESESRQNAQPSSPPPARASQEPVGTAAAETIPTVGVAASRPAGAALAPAKQRRVRTILIRMGAVVGAAAAVGVTMALTEASPSKPPGAH